MGEEIKGVCSLWEDEKQKDLLKTEAPWRQVGQSQCPGPRRGRVGSLVGDEVTETIDGG